MTPSVKQLEQTYRQTYRRLIAITFAYVLVVAAGIVLLVSHPRTADWVAEAVQAEFAATNAPPSH
jgi:Na+(H+)/acetate symporter ActP